MNKNIKKILVVILMITIISTSTVTSYQETKALGVEIVVGTLTVMFVGACIVGCDYLHNPDKYSDMGSAMKDFGNATVENQKKLYEIEKANFDMVMQKAVDAGVGSCIVGSDGKLYSATQLQAQEYPDFDTWKGYKEKETEKPKKSLWDKFKLLEPFVGLLCDLFPDSGSGGSSDAEDEQLYYTGDDGYMDEDGNFTIRFQCRNVHYVDAGDTYSARNENSIVAYDNYSLIASGTFPTTKYRIWGYVAGSQNNYFNEYDQSKRSVLFRGFSSVGITYYSGSGSYKSFNSSPGIADSYEFKHTLYSTLTHEYESVNSSYMYMSLRLLDGVPNVYLYDYLSTNIPVFDSFYHGQLYYSTGSLEGLINGAPQESTPTPQPSSEPHIGPVQQYTNYFSTNFSPSVVPYYVNYNIVNNWDGDTNTFNINNFIVEDSDEETGGASPTPDLRKPTFTPMPNDGGDTTNNYDVNITNNILIEQTNIIQEINQTVTNIYNFFIIDVDVVREEINNTEVLPTDNFENFVTTFGNLKNMFSDDLQANITDSKHFGIYYPKLKVQSPTILTPYVPDDVKLLQDGKIYIVLCDCEKYAVQFSAVRTLLKALIWFGFIFYLLKQLQVVITLNG